MSPVPAPLTRFEARLVLGLCPAGTRLVRARYFRHHRYPCPIHVTVALPTGSRHDFVVRSIFHRKGRLAREVALYPLLARLGLPVPQVLAGPHRDPDAPGSKPRVVMSLIPGTDLQHLSLRGGRHLVQARDLLIEAVERMHAVTHEVEADPVVRVIPRGGLAYHLRSLLARKGPWLRVPFYADTAARLLPRLERIRTPLVFSNGDYQPANFLAEDGRLTGLLDFEYAWFEDPLYGFCKYPIYDLYPLNGAGVVEAWLRKHRCSKRDFAPRLALACLATLNREITVTAGNHRYRDHVMGLLHESLKLIG